MQNLPYGYNISDARLLKTRIKEKIVDVTITSPPYWKLKDYGSESQIGFGQRYETYLADIKNIFRDVFDITKETGSLWIVIDTFKKGGETHLLPFDVANCLRNVGWKLQDIVIWVKDKNLPWSHKGKLRNIYEYILFFSKSSNFKFYVDRIKEPK